MAAAAAKAQQDPQAPWFLTEVTLPLAVQLIGRRIIGGLNVKSEAEKVGVIALIVWRLRVG